ncbi:hypothetical protein GcM3_062021 [Golovinomyces cichoracearum]|uniref:Uncharacterized protein n=1 Tax=Golovinomyces cichoracearum TaxID=62708 RepID=A0A420IVT2_9PEZI|nr:hypothetical protein GcM3_062021 [Golovinomyces cichoracearum]
MHNPEPEDSDFVVKGPAGEFTIDSLARTVANIEALDIMVNTRASNKTKKKIPHNHPSTSSTRKQSRSPATTPPIILPPIEPDDIMETDEDTVTGIIFLTDIPTADARSTQSSKIVTELSETIETKMHQLIEQNKSLKQDVDSLLRSHNILATEITRLISAVDILTREKDKIKRGNNSIILASDLLNTNNQNQSMVSNERQNNQPIASTYEEIESALVVKQPPPTGYMD